jgi:regulator of replication initiation timing
MDALAKQLLEIKAKVEKLAAANDALRSENIRLGNENKRLGETLDIQKNTIKDLEEYNKIIKIAGGLHLSKTDVREVKLKINDYIREIDRCIARLSE